MPEDLEYGPLAGEKEEEALCGVVRQCFHITKDDWWEPSVSCMGRENLRVIRRGGEVAGGLGFFRGGQWFGGRALPMAGISIVGVAPEHRSAGVAAELMARCVQELRREGTPLSVLYASTMVLYRKVGYEPAGAGCYYSMPTSEIGLLGRPLDVRSVDPSDTGAFRPMYDRFASMADGHIDRSPPYWERKVDGRFAKPYAYVAGPEEAPEGYLIFDHDSMPEWGYRVRVRDMVALTPEALHTLWALVGDHRSLAREVRWAGAATDLRTCVLPEQRHTMLHAERWLLRIVDVAQALEGRGYPPGAEGELHLEVTDSLLGENEGRYLVRVEGGRAEVERGGRGELAMDVRGLSPLYTGYLSPRELRVAGLLEGPEEATDTAARLLAGPEPWMQDHF